MQDSRSRLVMRGAGASRGSRLDSLNSARLDPQRGTDDATTLGDGGRNGHPHIDPWVPRASAPQLRHLRSEHGFGVQPVAVSVSDPRGAAMMPHGDRNSRDSAHPRAEGPGEINPRLARLDPSGSRRRACARALRCAV